jgi:hypothetical protein
VFELQETKAVIVQRINKILMMDLFYIVYRRNNIFLYFDLT